MVEKDPSRQGAREHRLQAAIGNAKETSSSPPQDMAGNLATTSAPSRSASRSTIIQQDNQSRCSASEARKPTWASPTSFPRRSPAPRWRQLKFKSMKTSPEGVANQCPRCASCWSFRPALNVPAGPLGNAGLQEEGSRTLPATVPLAIS